MEYLRECVVRCGRSSFAVDSWRARGCGAYFLTHAHADHLVGLSGALLARRALLVFWRLCCSSELAQSCACHHVVADALPCADTWCLGPLYCCAATAALLRLRWPALASRAHVLALDEPLALALAASSDADAAPGAPRSPPEALRVTCFDAGHCPGSVALLFEGACGRVLHTGDWRRGDAHPGGPGASLPPYLSGGGPPLDVLFLDNTFCHPAYAHPPRAQAAEQLRALLTSPAADGRRLVLGIDTLGKEELLELAAEATGGLVCVTAARLAAAHALGAPTAHLTTARSDAAVVAAPRWQLTRARLAAMHAREATMGVLPTGWPGGGVGAASGTGVNGTDEDETRLLHWVPYSLHAPFAELAALVGALRPRSVVGIVAVPRHAEQPTDPAVHFAHLLSPASPQRPLGRSPAASPRPRPPAAAPRRPRSPRVAGGGGAPGNLVFELRQAAAAAFCAGGRRRRRGAGLELAAAPAAEAEAAEASPAARRRRLSAARDEPDAT